MLTVRECMHHTHGLERAITRSLRLSLHYTRYFVPFFALTIHSPNLLFDAHAAVSDDAIKCSALYISLALFCNNHYSPVWRAARREKNKKVM